MYPKTPQWAKRLLFNIEAIRRNGYRRSEAYMQISEALDFEKLVNLPDELIKNNLNELLSYANRNVLYFKNQFDEIKIDRYEDLELLPTLSKQDLRNNREKFIANDTNKKKLWDGSTSGSTGSPLKFYKDPDSLLYNQIIYDKYYQFLGCDITKKRIRLSGVKILPFSRTKPPFWVYVDVFRQLQCSVYHISNSTFMYYLDRFKKLNAEFGTGLPSAWFELSKLMNENNIQIEGLRAIITDSEELRDEQRFEIRKAFNCDVYSTYGLGEVGMFAVECSNHNHHIISYTHFAEVVDSDGNQVLDGEIGEIAVTDFHSKMAPFIRYRTGDLGIMFHQDCGCGIKSPFLSEIVGRLEDYIITKDGRKFSRVSLIVKRAKNIKESQIIQTSRDQLLIRVVPDKGFNPESMKDVISDAHEFVGEMEVLWEAADQLERMPSGKVKFLIRKEGVI